MDANENNERISKPSLCLKKEKKKKILIRINSEKLVILIKKINNDCY